MNRKIATCTRSCAGFNVTPDLTVHERGREREREKRHCVSSPAPSWSVWNSNYLYLICPSGIDHRSHIGAWCPHGKRVFLFSSDSLVHIMGNLNSHVCTRQNFVWIDSCANRLLSCKRALVCVVPLSLHSQHALLHTQVQFFCSIFSAEAWGKRVATMKKYHYLVWKEDCNRFLLY